MTATILVVAKAPVPGRVKTRLAADLGPGGSVVAAELAAAALLDTLTACAEAFSRRRIALAGELTDAVAGAELRQALADWTIAPQVGDGLGPRLAHAHRGVGGPVVQIGMDTPQVTAARLRRVGARLADHDAVLAPAHDGGWWALALRDPRAADALAQVPMSTPTTYDDTRRALAMVGLTVERGEPLRDVDHLSDVAAVSALAPRGRFARAAARLLPESVLPGSAR